MSLGSNIRSIRRARKLSMAALAEKLGTHASNIQRWETDRVSPRHNTVGRIAKALGVGPADLVETEEERAHSRSAARHWARELRSADEKDVLRFTNERGVLRMPRPWKRRVRDGQGEENSGSSAAEEAITKERLLSQLMRLPGYKELGDALATIPPEMGPEEFRRLAAIVEAFVSGGDG
jgi:transcriptional regulator with XRE-family HTH domain